MDLDDVEGIDLTTLVPDMTWANDLSGTDVVEVNTNLAAFGGAGDAAVDNVIVQGTDDVVIVAGDGPRPAAGLAAQVNITGAEGATDHHGRRRRRGGGLGPGGRRSSSPPTVGTATTCSSARRTVLLGGLVTTSCSGASASTSSTAGTVTSRSSSSARTRGPGPTTNGSRRTSGSSVAGPSSTSAVAPGRSRTWTSPPCWKEASS